MTSIKYCMGCLNDDGISDGSVYSRDSDYPFRCNKIAQYLVEYPWGDGYTAYCRTCYFAARDLDIKRLKMHGIPIPKHRKIA
jgi:hypothetical protein